MSTTGLRPLLVISPCEDDHLHLRYILGRDYELFGAAGRREGRSLAQHYRPCVILCQAELPDGDWRGVLEDSQEYEVKPKLIVFSSTADERLWTEVIHLGGWDALAKPFDTTEVNRMVKIAADVAANAAFT